jgi:hypothetical protein
MWSDAVGDISTYLRMLVYTKKTPTRGQDNRFFKIKNIENLLLLFVLLENESIHEEYNE